MKNIINFCELNIRYAGCLHRMFAGEYAICLCKDKENHCPYFKRETFNIVEEEISE